LLNVPQAEFTRVARGGVAYGEDAEIDRTLGVISTYAKAAVRRVHKESPDAAVEYFATKTLRSQLLGGSAAGAARRYAGCLRQYITWDGGSGAAELDVGARGAEPIPFGPGNSVRAFAHVVTDQEARILLWDELALDAESAKLIALPVFERIDRELGGSAVDNVGVWQLGQPRQIAVSRSEAESVRTGVESLLTGM
jgi:hypothetical protein